jgi:hypothetical protein
VLSGGNKLIVGIPATAKKGSSVRLISSNGEITYTIDFIPNTEVTTVLWTGQAVADDWGNQPYILSDGGQELKDAGVVAGDIITFHIMPTDAAWKLQIVEGHWGPTYASICSIGNDTEGGKFTECDLDANRGNFSIEITQEMLDAAYSQQGWGGVFVMNGDNVVVDKVTTTHFNSLETTLWEGNEDLGQWSNQPYILSDGGAEFKDLGVKAGQIIRCYGERKTDQWQLQVLEGHWSNNDNPYGNWGYWDNSEIDANGCLAFELTQAMIDRAYQSDGWGGVFVVQGQFFILKKITIE